MSGTVDPSIPIASQSPDTGPTPVTGAATVSGVFTNGAGVGLSGLTVTLTAADSVPGTGAVVTEASVGSTSTGSGGMWSYTLPNPLPATLQPYADANGGVLNLDATASGSASDGTVLLSTQYLSAGVATGSATTEASADARTSFTPTTTALHVLTLTNQSTPTAATPDSVDESTYDSSVASRDMASSSLASDDSPTPLWQRTDGTVEPSNYNPDLVNGTDYSHTVPLDNPCFARSQVVSTMIAYTTVGESHAYYDAKASFSYNSTMSTSIGVGESMSGADWSISGTENLASSFGHSTGYSPQGPYFAWQYRVPIQYYKIKHYWTCLHGNGLFDGYTVNAHGYDVPAGGNIGEYGKNVSSDDGANAYFNSNPSWRAKIPAGLYYTNEAGRGETYGIAASAFGAGLSATTSMNSNHVERIDAGTGKYDHDIWGRSGKVSGKPGVVYSW